MQSTSPDIAPARGLLHERVSMAHFDLIRIAPSEALKPFIENYWIIIWDLENKPAYIQENLPHPSPNLVIDPQGQTGLFGIQTGKFTYRLQGSGRIFGVKFWPGALHAFLKKPLNRLTDAHASIREVCTTSDIKLERLFLDYNDPTSIAKDVETMLLARNPMLDKNERNSRKLVEYIEKNPEIFNLHQLTKPMGLSARSVQRLFETYIGIHPKWVIDRYRMLSAVDALNRGDPVNLTNLAHELGYFDQAHFTKAFSALTGYPPSHYRAASNASS